VYSLTSEFRFLWVFCQLEVLRRCHPARIQHALKELPESLDETYKRSLQDIDEANWKFARRLFQCVAVASRPLRVDELAEFLAFDVDAEPAMTFPAGQRPEDPINAVLSTCPNFLSIVQVEDFAFIQFSHISVKDFLTSDRLAQSSDISCRFHVSMTPAHMIMARTCLRVLLQLDEERITRDGLEDFPLAEYAAEHWLDHARFGNVSAITQDDMKRLFDPRRPHLSVLVWIYDPETRRKTRTERPSQPRGTCLHYAVLSGLPNLVKSLVTGLSPDVNSRNFFNDVTPLHLASREGYVEVARVLLEHGADAMTLDVDESTPLHLASERGHVEIARVLLERSADVNSQDVDRWTALHHASRGGHREITRFLLEHGADAKARNQDESTPLHLASGCGLVDIARVLLKQGADANAQDAEGWTPLHQASGGGHVEVVRLLLEHGASTSTQEHDVKMSAKDGSLWAPLHLACQEGYLDIVRLLLDSGENPNAKNGDQQTPLSLASSNGKSRVVLFLLEKGAKLNSQDRQKRTPLHGASENGYIEVMFLLLNGGADVNAQDAHLWTPLHMASKTGNFTVILALLNRGAKVDAQDDLSWTPLHLASQEGHQEIVRLLINRSADVHIPQADGNTALHLAACYGQLQVTQLLLKYGADRHAMNHDRKEPFDLALEEGHHEVVKLLEFGTPQPDKPRNTSQNQPVQITPSTSTTSYPSPSSAAQGSRSQQESTSQWGGSAFPDDSSYMGGFLLQRDITSPRVDNHTSGFFSHPPQASPPSAQIEYATISTTHGFNANLCFPPEVSCFVFSCRPK
jgi:ankyrin repeat protein